MYNHEKNIVAYGFFRKCSKILGKAPGEVVYVGEKETRITNLEVFDYKKEQFDILHINNIEDVFKLKGNDHINWINVDGLRNTDEIIKRNIFNE